MAATALLETLEVATSLEIERPDDEALYEIVDGQRIEIPPMSVSCRQD